MATRIRPMRPDDADAVADLTTQLGYPVETFVQRARIADVLAAPIDHAVLVAVDADDRPIGWIHVERLRHLAGDCQANVNGLVVEDRHRSDGIGAELMAAGEAWARAAGATEMTVHTRITRERAHRFYVAHGYSLQKTSHVFRKELG